MTDSDDFTPAFLVIDNVNFTTTSGQGIPVHQIEDVWVVANEQILGVFTLPARIPIIPTGANMSVRINAGVKPNGSKNESISYAFYGPVTFERNFQPEEEFNYKPTFEYQEETKFDLIEDFENSPFFNIDLDGNSETLLIRSKEDNNGGSFSGLIELDASKPDLEVTTDISFLREENAGGATFLEFDFKSDSELYVGYILETSNGPVEQIEAIFVPKEEWTRVYIDFTNYFTNSSVISYKIKFAASYNGNGKNNQIFLDNIKLLHF